MHIFSMLGKPKLKEKVKLSEARIIISSRLGDLFWSSWGRLGGPPANPKSAFFVVGVAFFRRVGDRLLKGTAMARRWLREAPERAQEPPKSSQEARYGTVLGSPWGLLGPSWGRLGAILEPSCASWGYLGHLERQFAEMLKNTTPPTRNAHFCHEDEAKMEPSWAQVGVKLRSWRQLGRRWQTRWQLGGKLELRCI